MTDRLTHLDDEGEAHMVDVSDKPVSRRRAVAEAVVKMSPDTTRLFFSGGLPKGDAAATARLAGIMAAKKTPDLIPLCHPIRLTAVTVDVEEVTEGARIVAEAATVGETGVEMEAMTAAAVAALTVYDMVKGTERGVEIAAVRLLHKSGGRSGTWER